MLHALLIGLYVRMIAKLSFGESMVTIHEAVAGAAAGARQARVEATRARVRTGRSRRRSSAVVETEAAPEPVPPAPPSLPSQHWWARVRDAAAAGAAMARDHRPHAPGWRVRLYRQVRRPAATPQPPPDRTSLPGEREGFAVGEFTDDDPAYVPAAARPGPGTVDAELTGPAALPSAEREGHAEGDVPAATWPALGTVSAGPDGLTATSRTELPGEQLTALPTPGRDPFTTPVAVEGDPQRVPVAGPAPIAAIAPARPTWPLPGQYASPSPIPASANGGNAMAGAPRRYALPAGGSPGTAVAPHTAGAVAPAGTMTNHGHFEQLTARVREVSRQQASCTATLTSRLAVSDVGAFHLAAMRNWLDRRIAVIQAITAGEAEIASGVGRFVDANDAVPGGVVNSASPGYLDNF